MQRDQEREPRREQRAVEIRGPLGDADAANGEGGEASEDDQGAEQSDFLADDREDKVGVRSGQVQEFDFRRAEPVSEQSPGADREQRLGELVSRAGRVFKRVHEAQQAGPAVRKAEQFHGEQGAGGRGGGAQMPEAGPAQKEKEEAEREHQARGSEIGRESHQHEQHADEREGNDDPPLERVDFAALAVHVVGEK